MKKLNISFRDVACFRQSPDIESFPYLLDFLDQTIPMASHDARETMTSLMATVDGGCVIAGRTVVRLSHSRNPS